MSAKQVTEEKMSTVADPLRRAARTFEDYLRVERGAAASTIESYMRVLRRYLAFLTEHGIEAVDRVRPADVNDAMTSFAEPGLAASTLHRALAAIRHFHRFCVREGLANANPAALVDGPSRGLQLPKALTSEEVEKIIEAASDAGPRGLRDRAMLELLYGAGIRVSELVGLDVDDVDTEDRMLRCIGKGEKERIVPIGRAAAGSVDVYVREGRPELAAAGGGQPALFLSARGGRLSRQSAWKTVKRYASRAVPGKRVYPHVLRHSFATHLVARGADIRVVQEALGHARLSTTQVYTLVSRQTLKDVLDTAHPRGRARTRPPGDPAAN